MRNWKELLKGGLTLSLAIAISALLMIGCSLSDSPTASDPAESNIDYWNPLPGDEIESGREVPILEAGYWESLYGPQINPAFRPWGGAAGFPALMPIDGASGGIVTLGPHFYVVPAGAVDGIVDFTLNYASVSGVGVDCGPSPLTFNVPVILTLSYSGTQYADEDSGLEPADLRIYYMTSDGDMQEVEGCEVDEAAQTITAPVTHFSRYILG